MTITGYVRDNGNEIVLEDRVNRLLKAGCEAPIIERSFGNPDSAPRLDHYLSSVKEGDQLLICDIQSLSRNIEVVVKVVTTLRQKKAELRTLDEMLDSSTPEGRLAINVRAAVNQYIWSLPADEAQQLALSDTTPYDVVGQALKSLWKKWHSDSTH